MPSTGGRWSPGGGAAGESGRRSSGPPPCQTATRREGAHEAEVVARVEGAEVEPRLPGRLLELGAGAVELVRIGGADGEEAGELELGVAGDELGFAFEHG